VEPFDPTRPREALVHQLSHHMQRWGYLEDPAPPAALRWIDTFIEAFGAQLSDFEQARPLLADLRAESCTIPALELERLRSREALFFLDAVAQYVDHESELRGLPLDHDIPAIGEEFGLSRADALHVVRMALTGRAAGPPLELLFPLLGHDRILIRVGAVNSRLLHGRGLEPIAFGPDGKPFEPIHGRRPQEPEEA
jgi:glutamyl/glutaminyl-tRNA synthetase